MTSVVLFARVKDGELEVCYSEEGGFISCTGGLKITQASDANYGDWVFIAREHGKWGTALPRIKRHILALPEKFGIQCTPTLEENLKRL